MLLSYVVVYIYSFLMNILNRLRAGVDLKKKRDGRGY